MKSINKLFNYIVNHHQDFMRYAMILTAVLIVTWFFPKAGKFKYDFEFGKPWTYDNLIAPFDYAIKKSEESLYKERLEIDDNFSPYFKLDESVFIDKKLGFTEEFTIAFSRRDSTITLDSLKGLNAGISIISELYEKGIIQLNDELETLDPNKVINLLKVNIAEKKKISGFYRLKDAFQYMKESLLEYPDLPPVFMMPLLENAIAYNIYYDKVTTEKFKTELLENLSTTRGMVQEGEMVITRGTIITEDKFQKLVSFKDEYEERVVGSDESYLIILGYLIITLIIFSIFTFFIRIYSREIFFDTKKLFFVFLLITLTLVALSTVVKAGWEILYTLPFCLLPIILSTFFGSRHALHTYIVIMLLSGLIVPYGFGFILMQFTAGLVAIFANVRAFYWSQFFVSSLFILITYFFMYFGVSIIQEGNLQSINWSNFGWLTLNGLLTLLAYPLIPLFERLFGFVSDITLVELTDINKPLLKELSIKAPGTFQHSLQVANLSESAAYEIRANTLLVKVGALYHDIGKIEKPSFFIENQNPNYNPHDELPFEESASIIIDHVTSGVKIAKKHKLPEVITDFIRSHHGTSRVEYFYQSYLKNFPGKEVDEKRFRYPGPLPYSKETAIVMMADCCEAAARSLNNPTDEDIELLVERLINFKIEQNQFINSDINFKEIRRVKEVIKKMLKSIYHVRITYPEEQKAK